MALDPEKLRAQRRARQAQREKESKKLRIRLIVAGCVLLVLAVAAILFVTGVKKGPSASKPEASVPETTAPATTVIHLAAAGDLNITENVVNSGAGGGEYDYTKTFLDVAHLLADADITALNFEGCLYGAPYGTDRSAPQALAQALDDMGVDLVQLANSYSIYKGMDGLESTIRGIREAGMEPLGVYENAEAARKGKGYTIRNVEGIKIAFVAFTKGMDGMALPAGNDGCVNLLYSDYATDYQALDRETVNKILDAVNDEKPDLTVALLHWGSEFNDTISSTQKEVCALLQEGGVDAIIGTHSHYVQQMTLDKETGNFVAYSLGDFFGDASRAGSEYSVILDLEITKNQATGDTKITNFTYTPIFTAVEKDQPLRVLRIREAMTAYESSYIDRVSEDIYKKMEYAMGRIEARIHGK
ncbi:MAG: CapA family protein [Oscillospiraceae bacterium]|nr:CapA family protein [Oscillospiraceae bacterium]